MDAGALFDFMGNPSPTQTSHMLYPDNTYTAAKCEGGFQDMAYADPYTTDFDGAACLGTVPIAGAFTAATCRDSNGGDAGGADFVNLPTRTQCEGADHLFVVQQTDDTVNPTITNAIMNYGTGLLILTADETLDGISGTEVSCINGTAMVIKSLPTGDTYIPSDCDFDSSGTFDDDQSLCENAGRSFTPPTCARCLNANGDIAGDSSSQSSCENDPDGGTYLANGGDASSEIICRGAAHVFTPVSLTGLRIATGYRKDGVSLTLKLPESIRLQIQEQESLTQGTALTLSIESGAVSDLTRNPVNANATLQLATVPDTQPPIIERVQLDLGTGVLTVTTDEAILLDLTTGEGLAKHKMRLSNQTMDIAPVPSSCSDGRTDIEQEACTGLTGFIFTDGSCSNNAAYNSNEAACKANSDPGVGIFTPAKCTRPNGVVVSDDGTGYAASNGACIGSDNGFGRTFVARYEPTKVDFLENSNTEIIHLGTGNVFTAATTPLCKDAGGANVGGDPPYTGSSFDCTGVTGFTFSAAQGSSCAPDASHNNDQVGCTGFTGNAFTPEKCVGGTSAADPYLQGDIGTLCINNGGSYTAASCTNGGNSASEVACVGADNGNGNTFTAAKGDECRDTSQPGSPLDGDNTSQGACEGTPNTNTYYAATPNSCTNGGDATSQLKCEGTVFLGKVGGSASSVQFQLYLGEYNRTRALRLSNTSGGDLTPMFFSVEPGAFTDMSSLRNNNTGALVVLTELPDTVAPNLISASMNYSTGDLVIVSDELLDLTSMRFVSIPFNTQVLRLTDISDDFSAFSQIAILNGSVATPGVEIEDGFQIRITVTEAQRAAAVVRSRTYDSEAVYLSVFSNFVVDYAGNSNAQSNALPLNEADDIVPPSVIGARLDLGTGRFTLTASETIRKLFPQSFLNLTNKLLRNDGGAIPFNLGDSSHPHTVESASLYFEQRVAIPGTESDNFPKNTFVPSSCSVLGDPAPGFDNDKTGCITNVPTGVFTENTCNGKDGEAIDSDGTGTALNVYSCELWSVGNHLDNSADAVEVSFTLPEPMRIAALRMSNTTGGDGTPLRFQVFASAFKDLSENMNIASASCGGVTGYTGSKLGCTGLTGNVFQGAVPNLCQDAAGGSGNDVGDATTQLSCTGVTGNSFSAGITASCTDGTNGGTRPDCTGFTGFIFTAAAVATCKDSGGSDSGDASSAQACTGLNTNVFTPSSCDNNVLHNANEAACVANSDPGVGVFTPNRCADAADQTLDGDGTGTSANEAACRGTDSGLVFTPAIVKSCNDGAGQAAGDDTDQTTCEGADNGNGFSYTPSSPATCSNGGDASSQSNCEGPGATGYFFTYAVPNYCHNSVGTELGGGVGAGAAVSQAACEGTSTGEVYTASEVVVVETADTVPPEVAPSATGGLVGVPGLNYNTGLFAVEFSEITDGTPLSLIDLSKMVVTDRFNENNVSLAGSTIEYLRDRETVYITVGVVPLQNIITIADDAEAVEQAIAIPVKVHFYAGAVVDLAGNPSVEVEELRLQDRNNSRGVPKIKSMSFDVIETGFMRTMKFFGSKRLPGDSAKFIPYNSSDCNVASVGGVASPDAPGAVSAQGEISLPYSGVNVTFSETSPPGYPFRLCYLFLADTEGLGFQIVPEVTVEVVQLDTLVVSLGTFNQSVVGQKKSFVFGGVGVRAGDSAKWVPSGGDPISACDVQSPTQIYGPNVANGTETLIITSAGSAYGNASAPNASAGLSFGDEISFSAALKFDLCFAFTSRRATEPFKLHTAFPMTVSEITAIASTTGDHFAAVVNQQKNFAFIGTGVSTGDLVKYVSGDASNNGNLDDALCISEDSAGGLTGASVNGAILTVTGSTGVFSNQVAFTSRSNPTKPLRLCYKFAQEPFHLYPLLTVESRSVIRVQTIVGAPDVAVVDMPKTYFFVGTGQQNTLDVVKVVSAEVNTDAGCNGYNLAVTTDGGSGGLISTVTTSASVGVDGKLEVSAGISLNFQTESPFGPWRLCYKFHNEPFKLYPSLTFSARKVLYITSSSGSNTLFVANHRVGKEWSVYGYGLREGDKLKWVPDTVATDAGCGADSDNAQPIQGTGVAQNQLVTRTFTTLGLVNTVPVELIIAAATAHGGPIVLCYKFASEPYKLYSNIQVSVAVLTNVTVNIGSTDQIVVGATKIFTFDGIGLANGDRFKYVHPSIVTDDGCGKDSENAHDDFIGTYSSTAGTLVKFETASIDGPLKLCYKFGTEVYKLYNDIRLSVASVDRIDTELGDSGVAVVGVEKTLTFVGTAIAQNPLVPDTFKYIMLDAKGVGMPNAVTVDSSAEILTVACQERPSQTQTALAGETVGSDRSANVRFTKMSPAGNPYVLCYKFGSEPFRAIVRFTIVAKVLEGVLNGQPVVAVTNTAANITFLGTHVSDFVFGLGGAGAGVADRAKWVMQPDMGTTAANDADGTAGSIYCNGSPAALGSAMAEVDRRPCSSVYECGLVPRGTGQFVFKTKSEIFKSLRLCYRFGTEAWQLIARNISSLDVYNGAIVEASTNTAVVGRAKEIMFAGTTGIVTGSDAAKWIPFGSLDCASQTGQSNGGGGVALSTSPSTKLAPPPAGQFYGAATAGTFLFTTRPKNGQPYVLCYRFGGGNELGVAKSQYPFFLFPQVRLHVKVLEASVVAEGLTSEFLEGSSVTVRFEGRGIADGDLALWIPRRKGSTSVLSDATCDARYAATISSSALSSSSLFAKVVDAKANFVFGLESEGMNAEKDPVASVDFVLCYKFVGEAFKLYASLPIVDEREATKLLGDYADTFQNSRAKVQISLTTLRNDPTTDLDHYPVGSDARAAFIEKFRADMSRALNIRMERIRVLSLSRGSIIVEFVIDPVSTTETGGLLARQAAALLEQMVSDQDPLIFGGDVTQYVDTSPAASPNPQVTIEPVTSSADIDSATSSGDTGATSEGSEISTSAAAMAGALGDFETVTELIGGVNVTTYVATSLAGVMPAFTTLRVVPPQASGLFAFKHRDFNVVEDIGLASITVLRLSGSKGRVVVAYKTSDGKAGSGVSSATAGTDYTAVSGVLVFDDGVTEKTFTVPIVWDHVAESHYETVMLELSTVSSSASLGVDIEGQALSARASRYGEAQIKIFDRYNPAVVIEADSASGQNASTSTFDPRALIADSFGLDSGSTNATMGWGIVGNGGSGVPSMGTGTTLQPLGSELAAATTLNDNAVVSMTSSGDVGVVSRSDDSSLDDEVPLWVDTNGLYSVDRLYGSSEYNAACDYAAPVTPCAHSCAYGGDYGADNGNGTGYGSGVLRLNGPEYPDAQKSAASFVTTGAGTMLDFPTSAWSFSVWIRSAAGSVGTIVSYEVPANTSDGMSQGSGAHELLVYNASSIVLVIRGTVNLADSRRQMGLSTGVNVADGTWHHLMITWTAAGGEVVVYKDGIIAFDGGPYQAEASLQPGGSLVVGQAQRLNTPCLYSSGTTWSDPSASDDDSREMIVTSTASASSSSPCLFEQGGMLGALAADIQNVRLWDHVRSQHQVHLGMRWPFTALRLGLILYWHFDPLQSLAVGPTNMTASVPDAGEDGQDHPGVLSPYGTSVVPGEGASTNPNYPCGDVYSNIWYWTAPKRFLSQLRYAYDGRLQYSMLVSSFSGTERSARGSVELQSMAGHRYSYALEGFESLKSGRWMGYSVVFREDFGWTSEPSGEPATFEQLYAALQSPKALLVRGDHFVYSTEGTGGEASYINNVTLTSAREI
jgi:hypothetical protein